MKENDEYFGRPSNATREGLWAQYDLDDGPRIGGVSTILFCLWLAWCRFRVVSPLLPAVRASRNRSAATSARAL